MKRLILVLIAVLMLGSTAPCAAVKKQIKGPINIESDQITYEHESDSYTATGNVIITFEGGSLKADSVYLNRKTGNAVSTGRVKIQSDGDLLAGDRIEFNVEDKTGVVYNGRAFFQKNHFYLTGDRIEKRSEANYFLKNATATTCDGPDPAWRFTGKEIDVTVDGYGTIKGGTFDVRNRSLLYLPYFFFPAKTTRQSGFLLPMLGFSNKNGWDAELPFYWAISESADATFYQRYMTRRGFKEGVELRYFPSKDTFGTIFGDYMNDMKKINETEENLLRDWQDDHRRWSYYINHETTFSPGFYFRSDIKKVSDHWYFRDFEYNYYLSHYTGDQTRRFERISFLGDRSLSTLDSTARVVKEFNNYNLTMLARYTDDLRLNSNETTLQRYPEITFTGFRHPVFGTPVNFEMNSAYDYLYRHSGGDRGHLVDVNPAFSLPLNLGSYLQLTPSLGFRETYWNSQSTIANPGRNGSRELVAVGAVASTEVYRVFDFGAGGIEKIRHGIRPEVTYTYIPTLHQEPLADYVTPVNDTNSVTYGVTNTITSRSRGKDGRATYRELFWLRLTQTFDIREAVKHRGDPALPQRPFSAVNAEMNFNPVDYLAFHSEDTFDFNTGHWLKTNHDLWVTDPRGDAAVIGYRFTRDAIEEINASLKIKATREIDLIYILRRNARDAVNLENTFGVNYHRQCWGVEVDYSDLIDDKRVMVFFTLYGIGRVGNITAPGF